MKTLRWTPLAVALLLVVLCVGGCRDGGSLLFSVEDEVRIGREAAAEFEKENPISGDAALNRLVNDIGADIAAAARPPNYPYEFRVIDKPVVNAVAFPGGRIYMYCGLIEKLNGDRDMIAWVLGHEAAHVALQHAAKRIEREIGVQALTELLLGKSTAGKIAGVVSELMFRDYGRDNELQADRTGVVFAHKAGYDATAAIGVIRIFQQMSGGKDPNKLELLFMTHPGDNTRLNNIRAELKRLGYTGRFYP